MGMLNGDMGQDDTIGEDDFGGLSGLGGMDPETGQPNIGSWATAKEPDRTMDQAMSLFSKEDDPATSMAKAYGLKGKGYTYSDSFDFSKTALQHTNFIVDLMNKEFQKTYGVGLKDAKSVRDAMTKDQKEAMSKDADTKTNAILSGIPDNIKDEVAMGVNLSVANLMGYGPNFDTKEIPDWYSKFHGLPKIGGWAWTEAAKAIVKNPEWTGYKTGLILEGTSLAAVINNMLGEDPSQEPDVTAIESGDGPD
jgi:hypothetical protein